MPILGGCLCFDLPTGCKIIGVFYIVCSLLNTLMLAILNVMLWALDMLPSVLKFLKNSAEQTQSGHSHSDDHSHGNFSHDDFDDYLENIQEHTYAVKVVFLILLALSFLSIITSSMLIHGVRKNRRGMLVPWVLQETLHIFITIALIVAIFILLGVIKVSWTLTLPMMLTSLIQVFFIIVVVSQFQALGLIRMHDEMCMK